MATKLTREDIKFEWKRDRRNELYIVIMGIGFNIMEYEDTFYVYPLDDEDKVGPPDLKCVTEKTAQIWCEERILNAINSILK